MVFDVFGDAVSLAGIVEVVTEPSAFVIVREGVADALEELELELDEEVELLRE